MTGKEKRNWELRSRARKRRNSDKKEGNARQRTKKIKVLVQGGILVDIKFGWI